MDSSRNTEMESRAPDPYRHNAFRLSGLPVDATPRQLRRRTTELESAKSLDMEVSAPTGWFPPNPPPTVDESLEALQRLKNPESRLEEELFWFWPDPEQHPQEISIEEAEQVWRSDDVPPERLHFAQHNRAVAHHLKILQDPPSESFTVEYRWVMTYRHWHVFLNSAPCREWLSQRVRAIDDPRLGQQAVADVLQRLPARILRTHAAVARDAALNSDVEYRARTHVRLMRHSNFDKSTVDAELSTVAEPHFERLRSLEQRFQDAADTEETEAVCDEIEQALNVGEDAVVLRRLFRDHHTVAGVQDALVRCVLQYVVTKQNKHVEGEASAEIHSILEDCLARLSTVGKFASGPDIKQRHKRETATTLHNIMLHLCLLRSREARDNPQTAMSNIDDLLRQADTYVTRLRDFDPEAASAVNRKVYDCGCSMVVEYVNATGNADHALRGLKALRDKPAYRHLNYQTDELWRTLTLASRTPAANRSPSRQTPQPPPQRQTSPGCDFCGSPQSTSREVTFTHRQRREESRVLTVACCSPCAFRSMHLTTLAWFLVPVNVIAVIVLLSDPASAWFMIAAPIALVIVMLWRFSQARHLRDIPEAEHLLDSGFRPSF